MGSETQAAAPAAAPVTAPAAAGGMSMALIATIVIVIVVVAAVVGYVVLSGGGGGESLSGEWTVSGGSMSYTMVVNNDTANPTSMTVPIPASSEVINFDDPAEMPEGMVYHDLGGGEFEITSFEMMGADFGTIHGSYDIDGDTMTITMSGSGSYIDGTDYFEIEFDYTMNLARA